VKHKARIVTQGYSQVPGQDFNATYASVTRFTTLRALFAFAAREDWELHQVDVCGAYLQGDLEEVVMCLSKRSLKPIVPMSMFVLRRTNFLSHRQIPGLTPPSPAYVLRKSQHLWHVL